MAVPTSEYDGSAPEGDDMSVTIRTMPTPEGYTQRRSSYQLDAPVGGLTGVPVYEAPFVNGELQEMRGWLEGLGQDAVRGHLAVFLHEGLFDMKGELEVFHRRREHNLSLILSMIERRVIGLSHEYPRSNFPLRVTYTLEWLTEGT